jgi:hypothetical protein
LELEVPLCRGVSPAFIEKLRSTDLDIIASHSVDDFAIKIVPHHSGDSTTADNNVSALNFYLPGTQQAVPIDAIPPEIIGLGGFILSGDKILFEGSPIDAETLLEELGFSQVDVVHQGADWEEDIDDEDDEEEESEVEESEVEEAIEEDEMEPIDFQSQQPTKKQKVNESNNNS